MPVPRQRRLSPLFSKKGRLAALGDPPSRIPSPWAFREDRAPETSPCQMQARQTGELDPSLGPTPPPPALRREESGTAWSFGNVVATAVPAGSVRRPGSAASRAAQVVGDGAEQRIGSVRWRLCIWAASARLRQFKATGMRALLASRAPQGAGCSATPRRVQPGRLHGSARRCPPPFVRNLGPRRRGQSNRTRSSS